VIFSAEIPKRQAKGGKGAEKRVYLRRGKREKWFSVGESSSPQICGRGGNDLYNKIGGKKKERKKGNGKFSCSVNIPDAGHRST